MVTCLKSHANLHNSDSAQRLWARWIFVIYILLLHYCWYQIAVASCKKDEQQYHKRVLLPSIWSLLKLWSLPRILINYPCWHQIQNKNIYILLQTTTIWLARKQNQNWLGVQNTARERVYGAQIFIFSFFDPRSAFVLGWNRTQVMIDSDFYAHL